MTLYNVTFLEAAWKEWNSLDPSTKARFKKKLEERRGHPHVPKDALHGMEHCYKLKLMSPAYRLVYQVIENRLVIQVIAIGKRDKKLAYKKAKERL